MRELKSIPNKKLEDMFLRIASNEQVESYFRMVDGGKNAPATTMATRLVYKTFMRLVEEKDPSDLASFKATINYK